MGRSLHGAFGAIAFVWSRLKPIARRPLVRRIAVVSAVCLAVIGAALAGLSWRLSQGPISLGLATPWLVEAIQEKLGDQQRVEVGGTLLERSSAGKTALRLLDVKLRGRDGTVVASAPKVEVGLSGAGLLTGHIRAERISLVGAKVSVRIETDGRITIFAGDNKRPIAIAPAAGPAVASPSRAAAPDETAARLYRDGAAGLAAMLAWIDGLSGTGLDGSDLSEIGLKNGTLVVEDQREGSRWTFDNIDLSITQPRRGGVRFKMESGRPGQHWSIDASATPTGDDRRRIVLEAVRVPARDLLLALRFADLPIKADLPISVRVRADIGPSGTPEILQGAVVADAGFVGGNDSGDGEIPIERVAINFEWSAATRVLLVPMQIAFGSNRFTLLARANAPAKPADPWRVHLSGGSVVLGADTRSPVVFNRIQVNAEIDLSKGQIRVENGEIANAHTSLAVSGGFDFYGTPRVMLGLAARPMSLATTLRLWPPFVAPDVRTWIAEQVSRAKVQRIDIAINAPVEVLGSLGPPIPDDGLSISAVLSGTVFRPVDSLPPIHDASLDIRITGRTATVRLDRGIMTMPSGRRLTMSDSVFKVADTSQEPTMSETRLHLQGPVNAAAELVATERLRAASEAPFDLASGRGSVDAQVRLGIPLLKDLSNAAVDYAVDAKLTNFSAEGMLMGQRVEAASLHLNADRTGFWIKGDVKIAGAPAALEYRQHKGPADDQIRLSGILDDSVRNRLGFDLAPSLSGPVPIKLTGRIGEGGAARLSVEADLTQARIDELLPALVKPPAKPARATFTVVTGPATTRLDDLVLDVSGASIRGSVIVDEAGQVVSANFPVFSLSHGDKASLKAERGSDGSLEVTLRGDVLDGRPFLKSIATGSAADDNRKPRNFDLDAKIGAIAGHNGEALRGLELRLSRRDGLIRSFALSAKLGRNGTVSGDLRQRRSGDQGIYLETDDAGALFRFTDTYSRISGGHMKVIMDPPLPDSGPQNGIVHIENFAVRGEAALDRVVAGTGSGERAGVEFTAMRVDFARMPGHLSIRDGVVRGPLIGATIDGAIDYRRNSVRMRGTLVPLYGINNMFGQLPIVGLFLGGGRNEGLVGITYEVSGPLGTPVLRVNPISAVAPGFIRKFFEFPSANAPGRPPANVESAR